MLQRFVERYQLWCEEKAQERRGRNPLTWLAIIALILVGLDIYKVVASHHLTWLAVLSDVLLVTFLVPYVRRSCLAWIVILTFGIIGLVESPFVFFYSRYPLRVRILSFCLAFGFSLVVLAYGFVVRRRYELYLYDRSDAAQNI